MKFKPFRKLPVYLLELVITSRSAEHTVCLFIYELLMRGRWIKASFLHSFIQILNGLLIQDLNAFFLHVISCPKIYYNGSDTVLLLFSKVTTVLLYTLVWLSRLKTIARDYRIGPITQARWLSALNNTKDWALVKKVALVVDINPSQCGGAPRAPPSRYRSAISTRFEITSSPLVTFNFKTFPKHRQTQF